MTSIARSYSQVRRYFENLLTCVMPPTVPLKSGTSTPPLWPVNSHLRRVLNIDKNRFIYTKLYGAFERMISTPQEGVWCISVLLAPWIPLSPPLSFEVTGEYKEYRSVGSFYPWSSSKDSRSFCQKKESPLFHPLRLTILITSGPYEYSPCNLVV